MSIFKVWFYGGRIRALVRGNLEYKIIEVDLACIRDCILSLKLNQYFTGFDIMSAILSTLLAVARYTERFGSVEGLCLDYVLREWCSYDPDVESLIASTIGMMLYGIVKQSISISSEDLVKLIEKIRKCVSVQRGAADIPERDVVNKSEIGDRSLIEF